MSNVKFLLFLGFFPFLLVFLLGWIIYWKLYGKKQAKQEKKRKEFKKKVLVHIRNFSPTRLKNRIWRNTGNQSKKKSKKQTKLAKNKQK